MNWFTTSKVLWPRKDTQKDTSPQPVPLIPDSNYENLYKFLAPFFLKLPSANNETNKKKARKSLESLSFLDNEQIVSFDKNFVN